VVEPVVPAVVVVVDAVALLQRPQGR